MEFIANEGKNIEIEVERKNIFKKCNKNKIYKARRVICRYI